ncbi:MAG TPA: DsbE family thiol:disulfide interchange protein [Dongiaceae bacterium]|nr:DsbE family thiol:disulfide interchange protein [Dongiaceae bacterium]
MSLRKGLLFSLPLILFAVLVYFFGKAIGTDPSVLPSTRLDQPLPAFQLPVLEDPSRTVTAADIKGPVLLNVWATWCPSCLVEHPVLLELARQGIPMVGLNYKDEPQAALKYLEIKGSPFVFNIADIKGDFGLDLGVYGAPESYLIDAEGKIRYRHIGVITEDVWRDLLWPKWQEIGGKDPTSADTQAGGPAG